MANRAMLMRRDPRAPLLHRQHDYSVTMGPNVEGNNITALIKFKCYYFYTPFFCRNVSRISGSF